MNDEDWNGIIDPSIDYIRRVAEAELEDEPDWNAVRQQIERIGQQVRERANMDPKIAIKEPLIEYARNPPDEER